MAIVIPLLCFVIPLLIGFVAVRRNISALVPIMTVGFAVVAVWALWQGRQVQGWDAIGYGILAVLMATPAALGTLAGAGLAFWRKRRAERKELSDDAAA